MFRQVTYKKKKNRGDGRTGLSTRSRCSPRYPPKKTQLRGAWRPVGRQGTGSSYVDMGRDVHLPGGSGIVGKQGGKDWPGMLIKGPPMPPAAVTRRMAAHTKKERTRVCTVIVDRGVDLGERGPQRAGLEGCPVVREKNSRGGAGGGESRHLRGKKRGRDRARATEPKTYGEKRGEIEAAPTPHGRLYLHEREKTTKQLRRRKIR